MKNTLKKEYIFSFDNIMSRLALRKYLKEQEKRDCND